jgi:hypothetical protein
MESKPGVEADGRDEHHQGCPEHDCSFHGLCTRAIFDACPKGCLKREKVAYWRRQYRRAYRRGYYGYGYGYPSYGYAYPAYPYYGYAYRPYGYYGYGWRPGISIGIGRGWGWGY